MNRLHKNTTTIINPDDFSKEITTEEYVNTLYSAIQRTWPALENLWDTTLYQQLRLIIADDRKAWSVDSRCLISIPYNEIQKLYLPVEYGNFQPLHWSDNRPTLFISLGVTLPPEEKARFQSTVTPVPYILRLATHEAFHFFVQKNGWADPQSSSRATIYPAQSSPRMYRNSIIWSLFAALKGDDRKLAHARYWYDLWNAQYPDDAKRIRHIDIVEGTARYVELAAEVIAQGHPLHTERYTQALVEVIKGEISILSIEADTESYAIGALSGFIMDIKKMSWQNDVIKGTPPLELLLRNVHPVKADADKNMEKEIKSNIIRKNNKFCSAIDSFVKAYNKSDVIKIMLNAKNFGSFTVQGGFFHVKEIPDDLIVGISLGAKWSDGCYTVNDAVGVSVDISTKGGVMPDIMVLYTGKLPAPVKGRLYLNTEHLSLDIPYPADADKTHLICI